MERKIVYFVPSFFTKNGFYHLLISNDEISTTELLKVITFEIQANKLMELFKLKESEEYIELNNLIKRFGWVTTGGEAKMAIKQGEVKVNNEVETRVRKKMRSGETVVYGAEEGKVE